jgi:hypothetical protein
MSDREEISINEWKEMSERGEVCGMFGCQVKPTSQCPKCSNHYCYEHIKMHIHVTDENPFESAKKKE